MSREKLFTGMREWAPRLFVVPAALWLILCFIQPFDGRKDDFPQYYTPARMIVTGHGSEIYDYKKIAEYEHLYFPSMGVRFLPVYLPPPSQAWFLPFGLLSEKDAPYVWRVLQALALIASLALLKSSFRLTTKSFLWLTVMLCISGPVFAAVLIDQVSLFLLFALSVAIWGFKKNKPWVTAIALAFLMLKPQEGLPLLVYLAGTKRYKQLAMTVGLLIGCSLLVCALIGFKSVVEYVTFAFWSVENSGFNQSHLGPTIRGQLLLLFPNNKTPVAIVSVLVFLITSVFIFLSGRRFAQNKAWLEAGLLIALPLGLLTCFHLYSYDLTLLVPTVVILLSGPLERTIHPAAQLLNFVAVTLMMLPFYIYIHHVFLLTDHWIFNPHFFSLFVFAIGAAVSAYKFPDKIWHAQSPATELQPES